MLRRVITCLLLGAFCCTISACGAKTAEPAAKDPTKNPVKAAEGTTNSPVKPEAIE